MTALASVTDVEALGLGAAVTADQVPTVTRLIELASGLVQSHVGQHLAYVADDTVTLTSVDHELLLPERPVIDVTAVSVDGTPLDVTSWALTPSGALLRAMGWWPSANGWQSSQVTVTYSHGYDPVPDDIVSVVAGLVRRQIMNPAGSQSETIGGRSISWFAGATPMRLSVDDRATLAKYRRSAWSVPVRA